MSAVSATYFFAAPECMGLLWSSLQIPMSTYYPIAVVVGILVAALLMGIFWRATAKYREA